MKKTNLFTMVLTLFVIGLCCSYSATAQQYVYGPNLVVNGDFSDNSEGAPANQAGTFRTDYIYVDPGNPVEGSLTQEGRYTIASDPSDFKHDWVGQPAVGENFMIVNGATDNEICPEDPNNCNEYWTVWEQDVPVEQGKDYELSFMLSGLSTQNSEVTANLEITIMIDDLEFGQVVIDPTEDDPGTWFQRTWTSLDKSETATITIIETSKIKNGNDFGLDDIVFRSVAECDSFDEVVTITVEDASCPGEYDGSIFVEMDGAKPFDICLSQGCDPEEYENVVSNKSQTANYGGLGAGWYTITIWDANGCEYEVCVEVQEPAPVELMVEAKQDVGCYGESTGEAMVILDGGKAPFTATLSPEEGDVSWNEDMSQYDITSLPAGEYTFSVTDDCGQSDEVNFVIGQPEAALEADVDVLQNVSCFGGNDGKAELTITGGTEDYIIDFGYDWDALEAGEYTVTVDDANECGPVVVDFTITQPEQLEASVEVLQNVSCHGGNDGKAELTITGGTEDYIIDFGYDWDALEAGEYTVTVDDANECGPVVVEFTITQPDPLAATTNVSCLHPSAVEGSAPTPEDQVRITFMHKVYDGDDFLGYRFRARNGTPDAITGVEVSKPGQVIFTANEIPALTDVFFLTPDPIAGVSIHHDGGSAGTASTNENQIADLCGEGDFIACHGDAIDVFVFATGGTAPYTLMDGDQIVEEGNESGEFVVHEVFAGTYSWTVVDNNGCDVPVNITLTEPDLLEASYEKDEILCYGETADVTVDAWGGTPPFALYDGEENKGDLTDGSITLAVGEGSYEWTVVDANGCEAEVSFTMIAPDAIDLDIEVTNVTCNGAANGIIDVEASGGTGNLDICLMAGCEEDNGEVAPEDCMDKAQSSFTGLAPGNYTVVVVDENGCVESICVEITEPDALEAVVDATDIECYGDYSDVTITVEGGTPPYTLEGEEEAFDNGTITLVKPAGVYNWTVIDDNDCVLELPELEITQPEEFVVGEPVITDATCFGAEDGQVEIAVSGGTTPYTTTLGDFVNGRLVINDLGAGEYAVTINDDNSCGPEEVSFEVGQPEELVIHNVDVDMPLCAPVNFPGCDEPFATEVIEYNPEGNIDDDRMNPENALGEPDYSQSPPITYVSLGFGGSLILEMGCNILNGEGDDFEVVETSYGAPSCDNYPEKADVFVAQELDGPWSYLGEACLTTAFDLENGVDEDGNPLVLDWAKYVKIVDVSDPADFPASADGYDVNGIHIFNAEGGGQDNAIVTVEYSGVPEGEEPTFVFTDAEGEEIMTSNSPVVEFDQDGDFDVTLFYGECESNTVDFTVDPFPAAIEANADVSDVLCHGEENGAATLTIIGGTAPYELAWNGESAEGVEEGEEYDITGLREGTYVVTIIDANGCVETFSFYVDQPEPLEADAEFDFITCYDGTTSVTVTAEGGKGEYTLLYGEDPIAFSDEITIENLPAGEYNWTVKDENNCTVLVEFTIEQADEIVVTAEDVELECFGAVTDVTIGAEGGNEDGRFLFTLYQWIDGDYVSFIGPQEEATFTDIPAGDYKVVVEDELHGTVVCSAFEEFSITQPDELEASFELEHEEPFCHDGLTDVVVSASGGTAPYTLTLDDGTTVTFEEEHTEGVAPGSYSWTVTDAYECKVIALDFEIENPEAIEVTVKETIDILCFNDNTGVIEVSAAGGAGSFTYTLTGEGEEQTNETGLFEYLYAGTYTITAEDADGCFESIDVTLEQPEELNLEITELTPADFDENNGAIEGYITGGVGPYNVCLYTECTNDFDLDEGDQHKNQGIYYWDLEPGDYMITVVDQNGCYVTKCITVEENGDIDQDNILSDGLNTIEEASVRAYPNPFTTEATIEFRLTESADVTVEVYNLVGERVAVVHQGFVNAYENNQLTFKAEAIPSGIYIYRITAGDNVLNNRIILTR